MTEYMNSWRHDWDWNLRFPWPNWWTTTLPEIIKDKHRRDLYFWDGSEYIDIIVRIYQFLFKIYKFLFKIWKKFMSIY